MLYLKFKVLILATFISIISYWIWIWNEPAEQTYMRSKDQLKSDTVSEATKYHFKIFLDDYMRADQETRKDMGIRINKESIGPQ